MSLFNPLSDSEDEEMEVGLQVPQEHIDEDMNIGNDQMAEQPEDPIPPMMAQDNSMHEADAGTGPVHAEDLEEHHEEEPSDDDEEEDEDDDDPVIKTYDIYTTDRLNEHLYLFQYPTRPNTRPLTTSRNSEPLSAKVKPRAGMIEVDVPIALEKYYDEDRGRELGQALEEGQGFESGEGRLLDRQIFGARIQNNWGNYMVGVLRGEELHLSPVKSVVQLKQTYNYVDKLDTLAKAQKKTEGPAAPTAGPRAVTVTAKAATSEGPQIDSNLAAKRLAEEDSWVRLKWHDVADPESINVSGDLVQPPIAEGEEGLGRKPLKCVTSVGEYLTMLSAPKTQVEGELQMNAKPARRISAPVKKE